MSATDEFVLSSYLAMLQTALASGYQFVSYANIGRETSPLTCLLRHDVDSELFGLAEMAEAEKALGICATYFLMTRSTAYNLFCVEGLQTALALLDRGHRIGLHFMGELCERDSSDALVGKVRREADWLERELGTRIDAVSFHQPSQVILDGGVEVAGLVNTYNSRQMGGYFYVSDSNMTWVHENPLEMFARRAHPRLQLLIHPMWWTAQPLDVAGKWRAVLDLNRRAAIRHWRGRERTFRGLDAEHLDR
jgi:hypothetical protein